MNLTCGIMTNKKRQYPIKIFNDGINEITFKPNTNRVVIGLNIGSYKGSKYRSFKAKTIDQAKVIGFEFISKANQRKKPLNEKIQSIKTKLNSLTESDAEKIFRCHLDGGTFEFPVYRGYHENGVGSVTQSFSCHILEGNKQMLFDLYGITDNEWNEIENPEKIVSWNAEFPCGMKMTKVANYRIKTELRRKFGVGRRQAKKEKTSWIEIAKRHGVVLTKNTIKKYIIQ